MKSHHVKISLVFFKILLIFLAVVFPIYFSGLYINFTGQKDIEEQTMKSAEQKLSFYADRLENGLDIVRQSVLKLYVDDDVKNLALNLNYPDEYSKYKGILRLQTRVTEIKNLSEFTSEVGLYIPLVGKKVSSLVVQDIPMDEFEMFNEQMQGMKYPFLQVDSRKIRVVPEPATAAAPGTDIYMCLRPFFADIEMNGRPTPLYLAVVKVDQDAIDRMLREFSGDVQGDGILLGNANGLDFPGGAPQDIVDKLRGLVPESVSTGGRAVSGTAEIEAAGSRYVAAYRTLPDMDSTLFMYIPQARFFQSLVRYKVWFWVASAATLMLVLLFTYLVRKLFIRPLDALSEGFAEVEKGALDIELKYGKNDEFRFIYRRFNAMCRRLAALIERDYEQRIRVQNAELKQLQCQINPHFLYNSLFILYRMAKMNDIEGILKLSRHMGGYYQFVTKNASDEVTLEEEIAHVKDYIQIQTIRWADRVRVEFGEAPENLLGMRVPRLILQPLVENAYVHGLQGKLSGGLLRVTFARDEAFLRISVEDNGDGMDAGKAESLRARLDSADRQLEDCGLVNVHRRLLIRYGEGSGLHPGLGELGGLRMEMRITLGEGDAHVQAADRG
jgi:two-component system sensor histidine kinase YesM